MVKVYRPDGVEEEKDTVDARECVEHCGYSYEPLEPDHGDPEQENDPETDPGDPEQENDPETDPAPATKAKKTPKVG